MASNPSHHVQEETRKMLALKVSSKKSNVNDVCGWKFRTKYCIHVHIRELQYI